MAVRAASATRVNTCRRSMDSPRVRATAARASKGPGRLGAGGDATMARSLGPPPTGGEPDRRGSLGRVTATDAASWITNVPPEGDLLEPRVNAHGDEAPQRQRRSAQGLDLSDREVEAGAL